MDDKRGRYKSTVLRILGGFQTLEFCLKLYIGLAYRLIARCVNGKIHFDYSFSDVETLSLGRLLEIFEKLNANQDLITRLKKLRQERNEIAHKSLLIAMGSNYDLEALDAADEAFFYLEDEVSECLSLAIKETKTLKDRLNNSSE
jgi:hypothetical protein